MSSLRRRWNRAFASIFALSLAGAAASTVIVTHLVGSTRAAAEEVQLETETTAALRNAIRTEQMAGHAVIDAAANTDAFLEADRATDALLGRAAAILNEPEERELAGQLRSQWDDTFAQVRSLAKGTGEGEPKVAESLGRASLHTILNIQVDSLFDTMDRLGETAVRPMHQQLHDSRKAERDLLVLLYVMIAVSLAVTVYYARRIRRDVLDPIARFRDATGSVGAGDLEHRVDVDRADEFGELATTFNAMAEALAENRRQLTHQAFHDPLTGLANRALLKDRLDHALSRQARSGGLLGVVLLDLDDFKAINDSLGHQAGDELLVSVAERLRARTREADTLARLGGDEFAILLEDLESPEQAFELAQRIVASMAAHFSFEGQGFPVSASLGVAVAEGGVATLDDVVRDADVAMYLTKSTAKGGFTFFEPGMHLAVKHRLQLKADLAKALGTDQLFLHYQPIIDLPTGEIVGVEALARWEHPELGMVSPAEFIPVAEESGLIVPLGMWVLEAACRGVQAWQRSGEASSSLRVSVNVSGRQLEHPDFVGQVRRIIDRLGFEPAHLVLEITETVLVTKADESIEKLRQLKALGVQLAIDDFGTGYSSLSALQRLPVDIVKIDRSFISQLDGDSEHADLARAVLGLGRTLHLEIVAEGVESGDQATELRRLECDLAQGYYFARPADHATVASLLRRESVPSPT